MFYARLGLIKVDGNNPQGSGIEPKNQQNKYIFSPKWLQMALGEAWGGLGGLKLDEIDAANSILRLPMSRNGFKWPVKTN